MILFRSVWLQPSKKQRLDSFVIEFTEELDTELKTVCYDISTKNGGPAIKAVGKIRRKVKAIEGKIKTLAKLTKVRMPNL